MYDCSSTSFFFLFVFPALFIRHFRSAPTASIMTNTTVNLILLNFFFSSPAMPKYLSSFSRLKKKKSSASGWNREIHFRRNFLLLFIVTYTAFSRIITVSYHGRSSDREVPHYSDTRFNIPAVLNNDIVWIFTAFLRGSVL